MSPLADLEAEVMADWDEPRFQRWIVGEARDRGWTVRVMDQRNGRGQLRARHEDEKGWPDLLLVRDRQVWIELKAKGRTLTPLQDKRIGQLLALGIEVYVVSPTDWRIVLNALA